MQYRRERLMIPMVIVSTVMALALGALIYLLAVEFPAKDAEKISVEKSLAAEQEKYRKLREENEDYLKVLGDRPGAISESLGVSLPEGVDDEMLMHRPYLMFLADENLNRTGVKCSTISGWVYNIFQIMDKKKSEYDSTLKKQANEYTKTIGGLKNQITVLEADLTEKDNIIKTAQGNLDTLETQLKSCQSSAKVDRDNLTEEKTLLATQARTLRKEKNTVSRQYDTLKTRLEVALAEILEWERKEKDRLKGRRGYDRRPDGEVVSVKRSDGEVFGSIDIGSKDGLKEGVIFDVMRGNILKGYIQVYQVDERISLFKVTKLEKESDPIVEGDTIFSPLFSRGEKPEFVVIGRFRSYDFPYDREDVKYRIIQWGGRVAEKITSNTKYVIIGDGELSEEQRRDVSTYSVERISKAHLRDFIEKK